MKKFFQSSLPVLVSGLLLMTILPLLVVIAAYAGETASTSPPVLVGSELDFPPYAFVDGTGQPKGFSIDLIQAVTGAMGLPIQITIGSWDTVWQDLLAGRVDVLPIVAKSPGRKGLAEFSLPHTETFDAFFVRRGTPAIPSIAAANGKKIVVMRSDAAHHELVARRFPGQLILVDTIAAGLSLIASGKHDAMLCSKLIGTMVIKEHKLTTLAAGPPVTDYKRVFSFAVKKGDAELLEKLNQGLLIIKTSGEYDRIYEKWLSADDPWRQFAKYLKLAIVAVLVTIAIAAFWLMMLQLLVKKRTRQLRLAQESLEEKVVERTAELARAVADLEEANAEMERFAYMISHDLKSPLVTINTFLGFLEKDLQYGDADRIGQDMHYMHAAADKMGHMLNELLEMSRIGRMVNPPQKVTFRELVQEALTTVSGAMAERGVEVQGPDQDITLFGDAPRLMEIWQNLLENAVKYMGEQKNPRVELGLDRQGDEFVFFVCDNGMGIEANYHQKIFGIFEKLDTGSEGTGIGLAWVKRIVEIYQGTIWVESDGSGQGACFRFTLPGAIAN